MTLSLVVEPAVNRRAGRAFVNTNEFATGVTQILRAAGVALLPVDWSHAAAVESRPLHHRDPFDRLLIAQARADRLPVVTADAVFARYGIEVIW